MNLLEQSSYGTFIEGQYIVVYGKDPTRIQEIMLQCKLPEENVIPLILQEPQCEWSVKLIGLPVCKCYGISPEIIFSLGAVVEFDF